MTSTHVATPIKADINVQDKKGVTVIDSTIWFRGSLILKQVLYL